MFSECWLLSVEFRAVHSGTVISRVATSKAIRNWVTNLKTTHCILGIYCGSISIFCDGQRPPSGDWPGSKKTNARKIGRETIRFGLDSGEHAPTSTKEKVRVLHGAIGEEGQIVEPHFTSIRLVYLRDGPEENFLKDVRACP